MKVNGPGGAPPEAATGPDAADRASKAKATGAKGIETPEAAGRSFAETLAAGGPSPASTSTPARAGAADALTSDIAADLKAGKIDPKAALDRVVERVLDQQLQGTNASPAVRDQLRDALHDTLSSDPLLTDRLRSLGRSVG